MKTLIKGGQIVNEGEVFEGDILIEDEKIASITTAASSSATTDADRVIDATGCYVLPGIIDEHVHFREPGLTDKADIESESRAAAAGGVTSFFDMPNCVPQTTTLEALEEKFRLAATKSHVNYSFFFGATNDNTDLFSQLDPHRIPGIKLFMGSSTGNMLVDRDEVLERIFSEAKLPIMAHCEDTAIINQKMAEFKQRYGDDPDVWYHPLIRSEIACFVSVQKAIALARKHSARLHIAHVSSERELSLIPANDLHGITAEVTIGHLYFTWADYGALGTRIKVNPAIKNVRDRRALRDGVRDGRVSVISTDHAPHLLSQKEGGAARAVSGMPMIQFLLPLMLELFDEGVFKITRLSEKMAHNPAIIFDVRNRGFLRPGYQADIAIVRRHDTPWIVTKDVIESKCGWSPLEGRKLYWRVEHTFCNGHLVYDNGKVDTHYIGQPITFR